ncbi:GIY-YIG nuclease family protein [Litoribacter ruber]|nr:GIY-YIG nuclease family protein [Litoribacter ruber]
MKMEYYVYITQSQKANSFYMGSSAESLKRLEKHNLPHKGYTGRK